MIFVLCQREEKSQEEYEGIYSTFVVIISH